MSSRPGCRVRHLVWRAARPKRRRRGRRRANACDDLVASSRAHPARRRRQGPDAADDRRDGRRARARASPSRSRAGSGWEEDVEVCEDRGVLDGGRPAAVSDKAKERGAPQLGSHGRRATTSSRCSTSTRSSTPRPPRRSGSFEGQIVAMIHCGSRGVGHQVCTDEVRTMDRAMSVVRHLGPRPSARVRPGAVAGRASATWPRWRRPRTTDVRTGTCSPTASRRRSRRPSARPRATSACTSCTTCRTTSRSSRTRVDGATDGVRPPQGRDARVRSGTPGAARAIPRDRTAGARPGHHGHRVLRPGRDEPRAATSPGGPRATVPDGRCRARPPRSRCGAASCATSCRRRGSCVVHAAPLAGGGGPVRVQRCFGGRSVCERPGCRSVSRGCVRWPW